MIQLHKSANTFLFTSFLLLLGLLIVLQNAGYRNPLFIWAQRLPYHDKLGHFFLFGGLSFFAILAIAPKLGDHHGKSACKIGSWIAFVAALEESSQRFLANRTFSLGDYFANLLGITVLGALAYLVIKTLRK